MTSAALLSLPTMPKLPVGTDPTRHVRQIRFTDAQMAGLHAVAQARGVSVPAVVRWATDLALERFTDANDVSLLEHFRSHPEAAEAELAGRFGLDDFDTND
jgi:hypothetical protein